LRRYAERGAAGFYSGATAEALVEELERAASALPESVRLARPWLDLADLAAYRPKWREPLRGTFRGREIVTMPLPSSGGIVLLQSLAVLEPLAGDSFDARFAHACVESLRRSFAERAAVMGDPEFVAVPVDELLSRGWTERTRASIGPRATPDVVALTRAEGTNTTHLSVVDESGNAVALTTTLNSSFGSGILVRGAGILLNNELDDFSLSGAVANQFALVGGAPNRIEPGKRPLSSMTPTVVRRDGRVELVLGSPGGPRIVTSVVQVLLRVLAFDASLADAVAAPRLHQQWSPAKTAVEKSFSEDLADLLRSLGHEIDVRDGTFGSVQAIAVHPSGRVEGASDPRRGGAALGTMREWRDAPRESR
jgi:gamma-glutamyltranspeptidase/glutathione hydrolase